jgi:hypothetical protein
MSKKFSTIQSKHDQCHQVEHDEKKIDPAKLVEDCQENVKGKNKNRQIKGKFRFLIQQPGTEEQYCRISKHGQGVKHIQACSIWAFRDTQKRPDPKRSKNDDCQEKEGTRPLKG